MTNKTAVTSVPILSVLAERWSPRSFDKSYKLTQNELLSILEAGRWAPSANNNQPTRYFVVTREDKNHAAIAGTLAGWNQAWAPDASAIILIGVEATNPDGNVNPFANYDAGQAVAHLSVQAHELGLHVHQMAGLDIAKAAEILEVPGNVHLIVSAVVGKMAAADELPEALHEREIAPRNRKTLDEVVLYGRP
ncbi:MAG: Oxygen-insensitive nitroreductase [Actinomycetota bacterium]|jgi:nitroreductase